MTTATKKKSNKDAQAPIEVIRRGAIAASIWNRQTATGFEYLDFSISRSWKTKTGDKEGYSSNYFPRNEEELIEVIRKASQFIRAYEAGSHEPSGNRAPGQADHVNGFGQS